MKNISKLILIVQIISLFVLLSCAAHNSSLRPPASQERRSAGEANFDPLGDAGDKEVITTDVPAAIDSQDETNNINIPHQKFYSNKKAVPMFAVQVFASRSSAEARDFKSSIASFFKEEIRVDYQAPYYKVIIGSSEGLDEAEMLLKKVKDQGYPEAWLVRLR